MMMRRRMMRPGVGVVGVAAVAGVAHHRGQQQAQQQDAQQQAAYDAGAAAAQQQAPVAAPAAAPAEDPQMAQLEHLAQMHNAGILTDEEFAAAKAKALGL
jgi:putative oligomerization/nucleic acid binding protein